MKDSYVYYKDKLSREYLTAFEEIGMYVLSQNVDESTTEERMGELLDIFLSAQEKGRPVGQITGNSMVRFCETFCSDFSVKNRIYHVADWFASIAKILLFVSVLDVLFPEPDVMNVDGGGLWHTVSSVNLSGYLIGIFLSGGLALISNQAIRRIMFKTKRISMKVLNRASMAVAVLGFLLIFSLMSMEGTKLFDCPLWVLFAITCVYLVLYYLLRGKRLRRHKIRFSDLVGGEIQNTLPRDMEKKFERARRRYRKKGKGELIWETFLDKEEMDCDRIEKMRYLYYILPVVVCVAAVVVTYMLDGFDGKADLAVFVAVILGVEYLILLPMWRLVKFGVAQRRIWLREKREEMEKEQSKNLQVHS